MSIFLKFGSVLGDVEDAGHTNWINLRSVSWGMSRPVTNAAGSSSGRVLSAPQVADLNISKEEDVATIPLLQAAFEGSPVIAQIDFCSTGSGQQNVFYTILMQNAIITAFSQGGADGRPSDMFTLNFTQVSFTGTQLEPDGTAASPASYGWDLSTNSSS
jgi:type VI secretion system secreted protein Hcp